MIPGSLEAQWDSGAIHCSAALHPPLQIHPYNPTTYILREGLCTTYEAPFMYLLIGSTKSLLIDTGDVADAARVPLAKTVLRLIAEHGLDHASLLVVHTHSHLDHRSGDGQFAHLPSVEVVGYQLADIRRYFKFTDWPNSPAVIDLGGRAVDVLPAPGHSETELCFYDRPTGLLFSGDFLMPGRLLVENSAQDLASARRLADFARTRPITFVLGGHIEEDSTGHLYSWGSTYHPKEHVLQMTTADLFALPAALTAFNGLYSAAGEFVIEDSMRILLLGGFLALGALAMIVWITRVVWRHRQASGNRPVQSTFR